MRPEPRARTRRRWIGILLAGFGATAIADEAAAPKAPRPPATVERSGPEDPVDRERRTRSIAAFGPPVARDADTVLLAAAQAQRWAEVLTLLKAGGANPNARDARGDSVLVLAAAAGADEVVRALLNQGAATRQTGRLGFTPLGAAAFRGHRSTVRVLLRAGVAHADWGATGQTALHLAALGGRLDVVDEMLRAGVSPDLLNRRRETALVVATNARQWEVVDRLTALRPPSERDPQP